VYLFRLVDSKSFKSVSQALQCMVAISPLTFKNNRFWAVLMRFSAILAAYQVRQSETW
jgi:hypothetical protein